MRASSVRSRSSSLVLIVLGGRSPGPLSSLCQIRPVVRRIMARGDNIFTEVLTLYIVSSLDVSRPETAPPQRDRGIVAPLH